MARNARQYRRTYNEGGDGFSPYADDGFAELVKADAARQAKYGGSSCPKCGKVYRVEAGVVEDHEARCQPLDDEKVRGM